MRTRSGQTTSCILKLQSKKQKLPIFLTCDMIRCNGDNSYHICAFCRKRFNLKASHNLLQCPMCKDVMHLDCMSNYIVKSTNTTINCPSCRGKLPIEFQDEYVNTDKLEEEWSFDFDGVKTKDDNYSNDDDSNDDDDSSNDDDSDDDSNSNDDDSNSDNDNDDDSNDDNDDDSSNDDDDDSND